MFVHPYIVMNDGNQIPVAGFGTYAPKKFPKSLGEDAVKVAIDVGYRHIDCAHLYENEAEVGRAIKEKIEDGTIKREELFCTGKLWSTSHTPDRVRPALEYSLHKLQLDYLDLYLIHLPIEFKAMEQCVDAGLVKSIGVSNFNRRQLELILTMPGLKHKPVCNQVECHVYLSQSKMLKYCQSNYIVLVGHSTLGSSRDESWIDQSSPVLLEDPVLKEMASKLNRTTSQIAMRYLLQRGIVVLAKSFNPTRIKQNFQVFDFHLSEEDMKIIDALNIDLRYDVIAVCKDHPKYPFHDEY
uniref:NADP-dependent oxidoreductase domain-containing protein n=1 Tax=Leptobrachium leishanense TaxID=445787 RepID=A0A8C5R017_9ANUR